MRDLIRLHKNLCSNLTSLMKIQDSFKYVYNKSTLIKKHVNIMIICSNSKNKQKQGQDLKEVN